MKKPNDPKAASANRIEQIGRTLWGPSWQGAMAEAIGVSKDTVNDWKFGRMMPRPGVYAELLKAAHRQQTEVNAVVAMLETMQHQGLRALARKIRETNNDSDEDNYP